MIELYPLIAALVLSTAACEGSSKDPALGDSKSPSGAIEAKEEFVINPPEKEGSGSGEACQAGSSICDLSTESDPGSKEGTEGDERVGKNSLDLPVKVPIVTMPQSDEKNRVQADPSNSEGNEVELQTRGSWLNGLHLPPGSIEAVLQGDLTCNGSWQLSSCINEFDQKSGMFKRRLHGFERARTAMCRHPEFGVEVPLISETFSFPIGSSPHLDALNEQCATKAEMVRHESEYFHNLTNPLALSVTHRIVSWHETKGSLFLRLGVAGICEIAVSGRELYNWGYGAVCDDSLENFYGYSKSAKESLPCHGRLTLDVKVSGMTASQVADLFHVDSLTVSCQSCTDMDALTSESALLKLNCLKTQLDSPPEVFEETSDERNNFTYSDQDRKIQRGCSLTINFLSILKAFPELLSTIDESSWLLLSKTASTCDLSPSTGSNNSSMSLSVIRRILDLF